MTVFLSIIATLAFESPIIAIEKMIFKPKKKPQPIYNGNDHASLNGNQEYSRFE